MASTKGSQESPASLATRSPERAVSRNSNLSNSTVESTEKSAKKIPPIKATVGLAKGPDLKNCKSKVGSLNNIKHTPTGGSVSIQSQKLKWNAQSKVGSLENKEHKPGGGRLKVESRKLEWKTGSKVQSLQNVNHKPGGGNVKIFNESYVEKKSNSSSHHEKSKSEASKNDQANAEPLTKNLGDLSLKGQ